MATVGIPSFSDIVKQAFLLESLNGPRDVFYYLDRFPEEIYNKSPDSHLYKYMRTLLGENGVNWIKKDYLQARILLEEAGIDMFDLDTFFGSPFAFGRIVEETFDEDPDGLIPHDTWEEIKAKNTSYRNRALDFINGARAGNTPLGMKLAAKAGLGHDVEIIENYKYLFDVHSDDPLGLTYYGQTPSTEEMIVLPRREFGQSEIQEIRIFGEPEMPNLGGFNLVYNGQVTGSYDYTEPGESPVTFTFIPFNATSDHVRLSLESIDYIDVGNVSVTGGPGPLQSWLITFGNQLSNNDVPELQILPTADLGYYTDPDDTDTLVDDNLITVDVTTLIGGHDAVDEIVSLPPKDVYSLQSALDRIRAQTTIPTLGTARGLRSRNDWKAANSSSTYAEVVRYVTGSPSVRWPAVSSSKYYWIESDMENEGRRINNDLQYHYSAFHNVSSIESSSNFLTASSSLSADQALADYAEPLFVTSATEVDGQPVSFINGIYPTAYKNLPGVPSIRYATDQYWASLARSEDEWLVFRFPFVSVVNYLSFDIQRNPTQIVIEYDLHDQGDPRWVPVTPIEPYTDIILPSLDQTANLWASLGLTFTDSKGELVWTRALRVNLSRLQSYTGSIFLKNLRAGRNVS